MEIEHDSISSRRYKENWDDAILIMNRQDALIARLKDLLMQIGYPLN